MLEGKGEYVGGSGVMERKQPCPGDRSNHLAIAIGGQAQQQNLSRFFGFRGV